MHRLFEELYNQLSCSKAPSDEELTVTPEQFKKILYEGWKLGITTCIHAGFNPPEYLKWQKIENKEISAIRIDPLNGKETSIKLSWISRKDIIRNDFKLEFFSETGTISIYLKILKQALSSVTEKWFLLYDDGTYILAQVTDLKDLIEAVDNERTC